MRGPGIWFDPPSLNWRRIGLVAGGVSVFVIGAIYVARGLWEEEAAPTIAAVVAAVTPGASAPARVPRAASSPMAASAPVVVAVPVAAAVVPPRATAAEADCGLQAAGGGPFEGLTRPDTRQRWRSTRAAWLEALNARGDERSRAAAALLAASDDGLTPTQRAAARARLVAVAQASADRVVHAFAQQACAAPGSCTGLPAEGWVRADTANAHAWLLAAATADAESPLRVEALQRAAAAGELRLHRHELLAIVMAAPPPGVGDVERWLMGHQIAELPAPAAGVEIARDHCNANGLRDGARRQQCEALADLFALRADTPADLEAAMALGERVGWPEARLQTLRDEVDALAQLREDARRPTDAASACAALRRDLEDQAGIARRGELAVQREALRRSPRSVAELARAHREARREAAPRERTAAAETAPR